MTIQYFPEKPRVWLNEGDVVCYVGVYNFGCRCGPYGARRQPDVTGIVVNTRKTKERLPGDIWLREKDGTQWQAQVLCKSGKLCWYPMSELQQVSARESWDDGIDWDEIKFKVTKW